MKLLIASDIHGDREAAEQIATLFREGGFDRLILLGDLLYHGPRNALPQAYDPPAVIACLNAISEHILAVRGNCDAEVDQMVLTFPILAEYAVLFLDGRTVFLTHGHHERMPLKPGDLLVHGHTHIDTAEPFGNGNIYLNPGSTSIPKGENGPTCMTYEGRVFRWYSLTDGRVVRELSL